MGRFHLLYGALVFWLGCIAHIQSQASVGPNQAPIGAYRIFPKTSFSCVGRPPGYYADIEVGCQLYHMCDGLGRQFSYSCPNTTLFQQRMLICDHWYMVNCSQAERDYDANLLIGQRDKPFVPEEEHMLRTPRPDLLDRPYAPDYSGESFRNQYKAFPPVGNQISENAENVNDLFRSGSSNPTRWRIRHEKEPIRKPSRPIVVVDESHENNLVSANNRRVDDTEDSAIDLGTSYSSNYNTSADISTEQRNDNELSTESNYVLKAGEKRTIKKPSKFYEPPFLYPIYNENYTEDTSEEVIMSTTTDPSTTTTITTTTMLPTTTLPPPTTTEPTTTYPTTIFSTTTTTEKPLQRPTIFSPRPFAPPVPPPTAPLEPTLPLRPETTERQPTTTTEDPINNDTSAFGDVDLESQFGSESLKLQPLLSAIQDLPPITQVLLPPQLPNSQAALTSKIQKPSLEILPPFEDFPTHDVATTQGPPIYYEWKIPSDALEPPLFDPPISVHGKRVSPDYNNPSKSSAEDNVRLETNTSPTFNSVVNIRESPDSVNQKENLTFKFLNNPFLSPLVTKNHNSRGHAKSPTPRSIQNGPAHINIIANDTLATKKIPKVAPPTPADIQQLQRQYLIPDFLFPLENEGRTGYEHTDTVNSFQLRIPQRRSDDKSWYGENPKCPECHPSYVKPGTCEPCIKRR